MSGKKAEYEARKAERRAREELYRGGSGPRINDDKDAEMINFIDRFVTAFERIADAMEAKSNDTKV